MANKKETKEWWEGGLFEELFKDKADAIENYIATTTSLRRNENDSRRDKNERRGNTLSLGAFESNENGDSSRSNEPLFEQRGNNNTNGREPSMVSTGRFFGLSNTERTEEGSISQSLFEPFDNEFSNSERTRENGVDTNKHSTKSNGVFQNLEPASTQHNRDVFNATSNDELRGGAKHTYQQPSLFDDNGEITRTLDTSNIHSQGYENKKQNDEPLGASNQRGNSVLSGLQDSEKISNANQFLRDRGNELEGAFENRSFQGELREQRGSGDNANSTQTGSNNQSAQIHNMGEYQQKRDDKISNQSTSTLPNEQQFDKSINADTNQSQSRKPSIKQGGIRESDNTSRDTGLQSGIISTMQNQDFAYTGEILVKGKKDRFYKNYEAIKLTKKLFKIKEKATKNNHNFTITLQEQTTISQFTGWGGVAEVFDENNQNFKKENALLKELLTQSEYKEAQETIRTAYFTPQILVDTIHSSLDRFGLNSDENQKRILEPSAGNGAFLKQNSKFDYTTIERNHISSQMLSLLYPNQTHFALSYESDLTNQNIIKFDAIIGNPPFDSNSITDKNANMQDGTKGLSVHNFFVAKSTNYMLKDDGILAFVISTDFMDAKENKARESISKNATFLGAVRLPECTFDSTHSSVDIVFFKKGKDLKLEQNWQNVEKFQNSNQVINNYFLQNPQNVLGNLGLGVRGHGEEIICSKNQNIDLKTELEKFIQTLPKDIYKFHKNEAKINDEINLNQVINADYYRNLKENNYFIFDNEIYIKKANKANENAITCKKADLSPAQAERITAFIKMRDTHKILIELEKSDILDDDEKLVQTRAELNEFVDKFHTKFGFMHNTKTNKILTTDVDSGKILALEQKYQKPISEETAKKQGVKPRVESCEKANILLHRVIKPKQEITFDNENDGLIASINIYGKPNIDYIATTLKKDKDEVAQKLIDENKIFLDPLKLQDGTKEYILSAKYLSGDVREKLRTAQSVSKNFGNEMAKNIEKLKEVIPLDLKPSEIDAPMGASWIPMKYYNEFFERELGVNRDQWFLDRSKLSGQWTFSGSTNLMSYYNQNRLSAKGFKPYDICTHALQNTSVVIKASTDEPERDQNGEIKIDTKGNIIYKKVVDPVQTQYVNNMILQVRERFSDWIFKDYERRNELARIYNDTFNCYAKKQYNGSDLKLDSLNSAITLRKHQKDAIFRAINEQNCLFDHEVGAGKTLTAICSVMKQKELGIIDKALIAVPNHLIGQWADEFYNAYPNANILVSDEKSVSPQNREEFFGKIMNGEYDAIIISHSQLEKIPVPPKITEQNLQREIDELTESLSIAEKNENIKPVSVKQMQKRLESLENRFKEEIKKLNTSKALDFSDLGIDCLVVDESHMYKNLPFSSCLKVKGLGNQRGSIKSRSMYGFTTYMNENDKKIVFLTGTPISNSLTELYNINKYLMPKELDEKGIGSFDAWAGNFAKIENVPELNATAQNFKMVSRFTALNNLPEVCGAYNEVADIVTNADIKKFYTHYVPEVDIIKSASPISENQKFYIGVRDENGLYNKGSIIYRMEQLTQSHDPKIDNHLKCTSDAKKAGIDFRLIDPNAEDFENSKMNKCVKNVVNEYHNWENQKGTQLIFLDWGTPKSRDQLSQNIKIDNTEIKQEPKAFENINDTISNDDDIDTDQSDDLDSDNKTYFLYGDLLQKLVKAGIPQNEIAFIHDTDGSNAKKQELFAKVNSGEIRVLIGSTAKMGAGTNVQERVTAIHHLDVPWRPSDFVQRNGRVIRQGNILFQNDPQNFKVKEFRYITEKTYDAVSWQIIETKSKSLVNFRKGLVDSRTLSGFEEEAASAAEMKAAATGNPLILDQVKLKSALDKEELSFKAYQNDINNAEDTMHSNSSKIEYFEKNISKFQSIKEILKENEISNFKCSMFVGDFNQNEIKFDIPKDRNDEIVKAEQEKMNEIFTQNFRDLVKYELNSQDFMEYRGFIISGGYDKASKTIDFEIKDKNGNFSIFPENLHYNLKENNIFTSNASFTGFIKRLNNFLNEENLDKSIKKAKNNITTLNQSNVDLKRYLDENQNYKHKEILELLKSENKTIMSELDKMSKNPAYKSEFKSKFLQMQSGENGRGSVKIQSKEQETAKEIE